MATLPLAEWQRRQSFWTWRTAAGLAITVAVAAAAGCRGGCAPSAADAPRAELRHVLRAQVPAEARPVAIDLDDAGATLLASAASGPLHIWTNFATTLDGGHAVPPAATLPLAGTLATARFTDGGAAVFVATEEGRVSGWDWRQQRQSWEHRFGGNSAYTAISDDGRFVAFEGAVLDRQTGQEVGTRIFLTTQSALALSADGRRVLTAGFHDLRITLRELPGGAVHQWKAEKIVTAALSPLGDLAAAVERGGTLRLWRAPGGEPVGDWSVDPEARQLRFAADGKRLVVAEPEGISVFNAVSGQRLMHGHLGNLGRLQSFATAGEIAAAGTVDGALVLWELNRDQPLATGRVGTVPIVAIDLSPAQRLVAALDQNGEIRAWRWR